ncbi:MAG: glycerate kinase [Oscillospiraceae bacterium]|nr:glycerate kinase [Oscillospiraceae bacterium]
MWSTESEAPVDLRKDCDAIVERAIRRVLPDEAVSRALAEFRPPEGKLILAAVGKAAWTMARAAWDSLGDRIDEGIVITKYAHSQGPIGPLRIREAGHPVPDDNSFQATRELLAMTAELTEADAVIFLLSGGGSALMEAPLVPGEELQDITAQMLACGADIVEMNTVRKRLSAVKGGRFARHCAPARVFSVVLSDILGDPLDMIASGPAYPDSSSCAEAAAIVRKYGLRLSEEAKRRLEEETPKALDNVTTQITGSVRELCAAAGQVCESLGYRVVQLTDCLNCEAREAGCFLAAILRSHGESRESLAFVAGGETVVHVTGSGRGGRNQELALAAAEGIAGLEGAAVFSLGSDGTDGPTDAAGGFADSETVGRLRSAGFDLYEVLRNNDAYTALKASGGLIVTGATGTNVNDVAVALLKR